MKMVSSCVAKTVFLQLCILLAARNGDIGSKFNKNNTGKRTKAISHRTQNSEDSALPPKKGRQRYAPDSSSRHRRPNALHNKHDEKRKREEILPDPPATTRPDGPFPTYLTCRHTYEDALIEEIMRTTSSSDTVATAVSPYPGLVRVDGLSGSAANLLWDPVYALQALPECRIVEFKNSIKGLARTICEIDHFQGILAKAPRGSLSVHALVPGMCRGQREPVLQRRSYLIAEAVTDTWKKQFSAARKRPLSNILDDADATTMGASGRQHLLLQIMLLSPDIAAVSLTTCRPISEFGHCCWWPNPMYPMGMAQVDITAHKMPSSAYRKLLEAFACWGIQPSGGDTVVDLGASPGGWTAALLLYCDDLEGNANDSGIHVTAVDRARLDPKLMKDPRVTFVQGDAFTFEPENGHVDWMVSDIIAYPDRVLELIHLWCGKELAQNMIITMKFQGTTPSWEDLDDALQVAKSYSYAARAKHFFNNKNEVTLMLRRLAVVDDNGSDAPPLNNKDEYMETSVPNIGAFYRTALPKYN